MLYIDKTRWRHKETAKNAGESDIKPSGSSCGRTEKITVGI